MSRRDLSKIAIDDSNSTFDADFIKNNTNFNSPTEFCHALGMFTLEDLQNLNYIPNIDSLIAKHTKFKTLEDFLKARLPKYLQDVI